MSIHKVNRGKSTTYRVRYRDEEDRQRSKSFKTQREAKDFDARMTADKSRGVSVTNVKERMTFRQLAEQWRATKTNLRRSSLTRIDSILANHILPAIGDRKLSDINRDLLQRLVNKWSEDGLAPRSILNHRNVLGPILQLAVDDDILHKNPASLVNYPSPGKVRRRPLEPDECRNLLQACDQKIHMIVRIALATGMRFSELAYLDVSDFNPSADTLSVRRSKTERGVRDISIRQDESQQLSAYLSHREARLNTPDSPLFLSPKGHRLNHSNFRRHFELALARAGIEGATFHDLRRTHATALVAGGLDPKVVQERMGHASIQTTLGLYAQATQDGLRNAASVMGAYLSTSTADRR